MTPPNSEKYKIGDGKIDDLVICRRNKFNFSIFPIVCFTYLIEMMAKRVHKRFWLSLVKLQ